MQNTVPVLGRPLGDNRLLLVDRREDEVAILISLHMPLSTTTEMGALHYWIQMIPLPTLPIS